MKLFKKLWERLINPSLVQVIFAVVFGSVFIAASIILTLRGYSHVGAYICYAIKGEKEGGLLW